MIQLSQSTSLRAEGCSVGLLVASKTKVAEAVHCSGVAAVEVCSEERMLGEGHVGRSSWDAKTLSGKSRLK